MNAFYAANIILQKLFSKSCVSSILIVSNLGFTSCFEGNTIFQQKHLQSIFEGL